MFRWSIILRRCIFSLLFCQSLTFEYVTVFYCSFIIFFINILYGFMDVWLKLCTILFRWGEMFSRIILRTHFSSLLWIINVLISRASIDESHIILVYLTWIRIGFNNHNFLIIILFEMILFFFIIQHLLVLTDKLIFIESIASYLNYIVFYFQVKVKNKKIFFINTFIFSVLVTSYFL